MRTTFQRLTKSPPFKSEQTSHYSSLKQKKITRLKTFHESKCLTQGDVENGKLGLSEKAEFALCPPFQVELVL